MSDSVDPTLDLPTAHRAHGGGDHPLYCVWEITLACDLGCGHCGSRAGKARPDELSTDEALDVVDQLAALGLNEVSLIGGEAYLRDDWHIIAAAITDRGMRCSMTTGARDLDQRRVDLAAEAGIKAISISIDGLERTHDVLRGARGAWQAATDAARRVADSPIGLGVNTQINRLTMPELPALADLLVDLGAGAWQVQLTVPMGRAADRPQILVQPYELLELFPLLVWIKQTRLAPHKIQLQPGNNIGYFGPYEHLLRPGGHRGAIWDGCKAGTRVLGLEADGKIKGCPSLPSTRFTGGNIRDAAIADVVENARELTSIGERDESDLWGYCGDCYYGDHCMAGCTWTSDAIMGRPGNNPYCIHRALRFDNEGLRERLIKVEDAPGVPFDTGRFDIVTEPRPDAAPELVDTILGIPAEEVTALPHDAESAWDLDHLRRAMRRGSNPPGD